MFPIRCVIECVNESDCVKCSDRGATIVDSFAIVAGQTPLSQLVETVLSALGLQHLAFAAKGKWMYKYGQLINMRDAICLKVNQA